MTSPSLPPGVAKPAPAGLLSAVATAFLVLLARWFDIGYLSAFRLPETVGELNSDSVVRAAPYLLTIYGPALTFLIVAPLLDLRIPAASSNSGSYVRLGLLAVVGLFAPVIALQIWPKSTVGWDAWWAALSALYVVGWALAFVVYLAARTILDGAGGWPRALSGWVLLLLVSSGLAFGPRFAFEAGRGEARRARSVSVRLGPSACVVVARYGERAVCVPVTRRVRRNGTYRTLGGDSSMVVPGRHVEFEAKSDTLGFQRALLTDATFLGR